MEAESDKNLIKKILNYNLTGGGSVSIKSERLPGTFKLALLIFGAAGSALVWILPMIFQNYGTSASGPSFTLLLGVGLTVVALTGILLSVAQRLGLGLSNSALALTFVYSLFLALVKFTLAPLSLYLANHSNAFNVTIFDANNVLVYVVSAAIIALAYIVALGFIYRYFKSRVFHLEVGKEVSNYRSGPKLFVGLLGLLVFLGSLPFLIILALFGGVDPVIYLLAILSSPTGPFVLLCLVVALVAAIFAFSNTSDEAAKTRNATALASLFWLGVSIILLYHFMWVIFMTALVTIWPFKTFLPNTK